MGLCSGGGIICIVEDITKKVSPEKDTDIGFDNDPSILPVVIAGFLLRKELSRDPRGTLYSEFAESSGVGVSAFQPQLTLTDSDRELLRENQAQYSTTVDAANKLLALAYSLPYLQGVILFALATLFPFFVITTAVMRQGSGLLFWAGAWVWVKSWDIGWAVIMLIDQLLWEFMPHQAIYIPVRQGMNSPITVLESAYDTDPTYTLTTYYLLIGVLLIAVPTIMGQLCLRSARSLGVILLSGVQNNSNKAAKLQTDKDNARLEHWKSISPESTLTDGGLGATNTPVTSGNNNTNQTGVDA